MSIHLIHTPFHSLLIHTPFHSLLVLLLQTPAVAERAFLRAESSKYDTLEVEGQIGAQIFFDWWIREETNSRQSLHDSREPEDAEITNDNNNGGVVR